MTSAFWLTRFDVAIREDLIVCPAGDDAAKAAFPGKSSWAAQTGAGLKASGCATN
ncbi:hypothetical protein [Oryzicola mucosus]|uniref:Uncharacterized protein n=1 Tax=Oryzicola mucosus TaxID=2767425 RepID=A0A8J6U3Q7_9HYPH|nr:hypothetical protein [Oryzicola mucosus]MBD0417193.1 hypothetical protein [Oryzicola mucosus]